jgi:hypothetical protein
MRPSVTEPTEQVGSSEPTLLPAPPRAYGPVPYSPPALPKVLEVEGDLADDLVFRRFIARQSSSQTLAARRTEWYARSSRSILLFWSWFTAISVVVGIILMIVLINSTGDTAPADTLFR